MDFYKPGENVSIRDGFGEGFMLAGTQNKQVVGLSADLVESVRMHKFAERYPNRFWNTGIQEQNMATVAAGLALEGFIPYMGTFANFQPGRNLDQIRTSICMMQANVKIISSHAGFSYGQDGVTVQMLEDIAIMRALPHMQVLVPADANQAAEMARQIADITGPVYLRLGRAATPVLPIPSALALNAQFQIGKAQMLREGNDITLIACGYMVEKCLQVAKQLAPQGIDVRVINMHTIKPLDSQSIIKAAEETQAIITVEEHQVAGGLGSAVAEVLAQSKTRVPLKIIGVEDQFGESGTTEDLWQRCGLTVEHITTAVKQLYR
jgi:transketolase